MSSFHHPFFMPLIQSVNYVTPLTTVLAYPSPRGQCKDYRLLLSLMDLSSSSWSKSISVLCPLSDSRLSSLVLPIPGSIQGWRRYSPCVSANVMPGPHYCIKSLKIDSEAILIFLQVPLMLSAKKQHCITSERCEATAQPSLQS